MPPHAGAAGRTRYLVPIGRLFLAAIFINSLVPHFSPQVAAFAAQVAAFAAQMGVPMAAQLEAAMFFKNLGLLGGALLIAHFGAGPLSIDARNRAKRDG